MSHRLETSWTEVLQWGVIAFAVSITYNFELVIGKLSDFLNTPLDESLSTILDFITKAIQWIEALPLFDSAGLFIVWSVFGFVAFFLIEYTINVLRGLLDILRTSSELLLHPKRILILKILVSEFKDLFEDALYKISLFANIGLLFIFFIPVTRVIIEWSGSSAVLFTFLLVLSPLPIFFSFFLFKLAKYIFSF